MVRVETTAQLREEVVGRGRSADAVVMAAAPADFRPTAVSDAKIKKADDGVGARRSSWRRTPTSSPSSAPTGPARRRGRRRLRGRDRRRHRHRSSSTRRAKLARKGCDLLVVNDVSGGAVFGSPDNEAVILGADGAAVDVPHGSKTALAHVIWDRVARVED